MYATGPDPFACSRRVRAAALARFGLDFDDEASYPRAGAHLIAEGRGLMRLFIAHREAVLAAIGLRFFGGALPAKERRDRAKQLVNSLEMDGTFEAWCDGWGVSPHLLRGLAVDLPGGQGLDVAALVRVQPARTLALVQARPRAYAFVRQACAALGGDHPDRTLRSYVMQDREAASREAKVAWAVRAGWQVVSHQHDGVVMRPPVACGTGSDTARLACAALSRACSDALGYEQPVAVKEMVGGVSAAACLPRERWDGRIRVRASPQGDVFERDLVQAAASVREGETRALAAFSIAVAGPALAAVPPEGLRVGVPAGEGGSAAVVRRACWASLVAARRGYRVVFDP